MGRTRATTRDRLDALEREWTPFRRSLRRRHQPAFDRLFEHARGHAEAATQQNPADPWRGFVFAVLLAQEQAIAAQEEAIEAREAEIERLAAEVDALAERVGELAADVGGPIDDADADSPTEAADAASAPDDPESSA